MTNVRSRNGTAPRAESWCHRLYRLLYRAFGRQHWWPGETPFEVMVGAILTQNTNWGNVERAIVNLKREGALDPQELHRMHRGQLASLIRPAGYYNIKAQRLHAYLKYFVEGYGGNIDKMKRGPTARLRTELLGVKGIGPETADSILLYALDKPVFVIDAYTRRVLSRHGFDGHDAAYDDLQGHFHRLLPGRVRMFNEYHALFVRVGKDHCRPKPRCGGCPLQGFRIKERIRL